MQVVNLKIEGDKAWEDVSPENIVELPKDTVHVAFLENGTAKGNPVVLFRSDMDGKHYVLELTGKHVQAIAAALEGKFGLIE